MGIVQGVGFRPFVFELANSLGLTGFVLNTSFGVEIEIQGSKEKVKIFITKLKKNPPSASVIEDLTVAKIKNKKVEDSFIIMSSKNDSSRQPVSPDLAICKQCEEEIFDKNDRRYKYPFNNCYNCGPRYTIIKKLPYDRKNTTMSKFNLCDQCAAEYKDPLNRRFHAEPIACSICGPKAVLLNHNGLEVEGNIFKNCVDFFKKEKIVAIKGIGGFNIACIASSNKAIKKIRKHKYRPTKPLALMVYDLEQARQICKIDKNAEKVLCSKEASIVLLPKKENKKLSNLVAPGQNKIGVMIASTPLHKLLIMETGFPLVMTSGNLKGEPIIIDNNEALMKLNFVDYFVTHNRDILIGYDDSVVMLSGTAVQIIRMGRGYAPQKITWERKLPPILAIGGDLKNSFALACDNSIFLSQFIGDLGDYQTFLKFEKSVNFFKKTFKIEPKLIIADKHPEYFSNKWALRQKLPVYTVQHHKAHIASVMVEKNIKSKVVGVAFDGIGYGEDNNMWGGEFFVGVLGELLRVGNFSSVVMPGGNLASEEPERMTYSYLKKAGLQKKDLKSLFGDREIFLENACQKNVAKTSSIGRMFDAVAYLLGFKGPNTFEAEAAMFVENLADYFVEEFYSYKIIKGNEINFDSVFLSMFKEISEGKKKSLIAAKFQNALVNAGMSMVNQIAKKENIRNVVLSGGVFQNGFVFEKMTKKLQDRSLNIYVNSKVPLGDGGLALGQIGMVYGEKNVFSSARKN